MRESGETMGNPAQDSDNNASTGATARGTSSVLTVCSDSKICADLKGVLQNVDKSWDINSTRNADDAKAAFDKQQHDCAIIVTPSNDPGDLELINELHAASTQGAIPVIVVHEDNDKEFRQAALRSGAVVSIPRNSLNEDFLSSTLDFALRNWRLMRIVDIQNTQMLQERINRNNQRKGTEMFAHELLTPLASIQEFVSLVFDGVAGPINAEQAGHLAYARGGCVAIKHSIDALVNAAESRAGGPLSKDGSSTDLATLLEITAGTTTDKQRPS